MNIFKIRTTWSNAELALLKLCVASIYVSLGVYFHQQLESYMGIFLLIFLITVIWILQIWFRKAKS